MYKSYFNLNTAPFKLTPDIYCFFSEGNRKAILDALFYAVRNGDGIIKVVGEVGSGKTLLSRLLAQTLPAEFEVLYLINPRIPPDKILFAVALELNLDVHGVVDKVFLLHALHAQLLKLHQQGKQTVLLIDEAQTIPLESLEEIRMLSNLETGNSKLLQLVLFGQPELDKHLNRHEVRQIRERIVHNIYLPKLSIKEVGHYLHFRLQHAGYQGNALFSAMAVNVIAWKSKGLLRRINVIAERCLLAAYARQTKKIGILIALEAASHTKLPNFGLLKIMFISGLLFASGPVFQFFKNQIDHKLVGSEAVVSESKESDVLPMSQNQAALPEAKANNEPDSENPYSIQLLRLATRDQQRLQQDIHRLIPGELHAQVFAHQDDRNGYQIFVGVFDSYQAANNYLQALPQSLKNNKPFIVSRSTIHRQYNDIAWKFKN